MHVSFKIACAHHAACAVYRWKCPPVAICRLGIPAQWERDCPPSHSQHLHAYVCVCVCVWTHVGFTAKYNSKLILDFVVLLFHELKFALQLIHRCNKEEPVSPEQVVHDNDNITVHTALPHFPLCQQWSSGSNRWPGHIHVFECDIHIPHSM